MHLINSITQAKDFIFNYNWYESRSRNQEEELVHLEACEYIALQHNEKRLLYRTRAYITNYYTQANNLYYALKIGIENYEDCQKENFTDEILIMLSFLISIHQQLGNHSQAEKYISICKDYAYELKDIKKLCNIHIVSANQYNRTGDVEKAKQENEKALSFAIELGDDYSIITIYNNMGSQLYSSDPEAALSALNKGMDIINQKFKDDSKVNYILAHYYLNFASIYDNQQKTTDAIHYAQLAKELLTTLHVADSVMDAELILASSYLHIKDYERSIQCLKNVTDIAEAESSNTILLKCYSLYHTYYEQLEDYKNAHNYLKKYLEIKDLIFNQESEKTIRNLQTSHEVKTIKLQKENAEHLAQIKHDFLANMSHEIRTPLNSIIAICYLLQQDALTSKQLAYIQRLERNGEILLGIINDILDISKIEADKLVLNIESELLQPVIQNVHNILSIQAEKKNIDFVANIDTLPHQPLMFDKVRLSQILSNLVSNAIKFTKQGSVTLSAKLVKEDHNTVTIEFVVQDTGIGISQEKLESVFEKYEQADRKTFANFGGTGLGLSISKKLCELMNGNIRVENKLNAGTTFIVQIPFIRSMHETIIDNNSLSNYDYLNNVCILIADDSEENRNVLKELLNSINTSISVLEATNGKEAVQITASKQPHLIFMDLDMPEMNGMEAANQIKKINNDKAIIIANTASLLTISKEELFSLGFDDLLQKPIRPNFLFSMLSKHLEKKESAN